MMMKKTNLYMTTSLLTVLGLSACGDFKSKMVGYKDQNQDRSQIPDRAGSAEEARLQGKWTRLLAALGYELTPVTNFDELKAAVTNPSKHVLGQSNPNSPYQKMMGDLKADLKKNRKKMRCGGITAFQPLKNQDGTKVTLHDADVFQMTYRDQMTQIDGQPVDRTALVTIPQKGVSKGPLPLLLHLIGGDAGLAPFTLQHTDFTPEALHNHIVIAPDYGMGVCAGKANHDAKSCSKEAGYLVPARNHQDIPWEEDVYAALAAHACVAEAVNLTGRMNPLNKRSLDKKENAVLTGLQPNETLLYAAIDERSHDKENTIQSIQPGNLGSYFQVPVSKLFGSSRGGLSAFIAAAWVGIEWETYFKIFTRFQEKRGISGVNGFTGPVIAELREEFMKEFESDYSKTTLMHPPMFSELISNGGPFSLTLGTFRMLIRDMVLKVHNPLKETLPGVDRFLPAFEAYSDKSGEDAAELKAVVDIIVRRDMHFLARFLYTSIVKWEDLLVAEFKPQHVGPGKVLLIHGKGDKMVPASQAEIAFGNLQGLALKQQSVGHDLKVLGARVQAGETLAAKELELFNSSEMRLFSVLPGMEVSLAYAVANRGAGTPGDLHHNDTLFWHESKVAWDLKDLKAQKIQLGKHPAAFQDLENMSLSPTEFVDQWMAVEVSK